MNLQRLVLKVKTFMVKIYKIKMKGPPRQLKKKNFAASTMLFYLNNILKRKLKCQTKKRQERILFF
jgi:hypothetical protein